MTSGLAAVVLAAGESARMGTDKALLPLGATTYIECLLSMLAETPVDAIAVVLGANADTVHEHVDLQTCRVIVNHGWRTGMLSSIQCAVREYLPVSAVDGLAVCLVDQPRIQCSTVTRLAQEWRRSRAPITAPRYDGSHGHPVVFDRRVWPDILSAPDDRGARAVVELHREAAVYVPVDDGWVLIDADTPAAHERMQALRPPRDG